MTSGVSPVDQHLDDAGAGQARVRHAEAVDRRVALEELRRQVVARLEAGDADERDDDETREDPDDRPLLAGPHQRRQLLEDRVEVLLALLALGLVAPTAATSGRGWRG